MARNFCIRFLNVFDQIRCDDCFTAPGGVTAGRCSGRARPAVRPRFPADVIAMKGDPTRDIAAIGDICFVTNNGEITRPA